SIRATQVVARVRAALRTEVPLNALFEAPTLRAFANRVGPGLDGDRRPPRLLTRKREGHEIPLSYPQRRLWFLDRLDPGSITRNGPVALRLEGPLDARALAAAFDAVTMRHESLRTTFDASSREPRQVVHPAALARLQIEDWNATPVAEREALAHREA